MFDCTTSEYANLYLRWTRREDGLLDLADLQPGEDVLDLCGGTGVISRQALQRGAKSVVLWDLNPRNVFSDPRLTAIKASAEELEGENLYDVIVCRQSIGYLNLSKVLPRLRTALRPGGKFVFNTFDRPRWGQASYVLDGKRYFEASGHFGRTVFHVQVGLGTGIDLTFFRWYPIPQLTEELQKHFSEIRKVNVGASWKFMCM